MEDVERYTLGGAAGKKPSPPKPLKLPRKSLPFGIVLVPAVPAGGSRSARGIPAGIGSDRRDRNGRADPRFIAAACRSSPHRASGRRGSARARDLSRAKRLPGPVSVRCAIRPSGRSVRSTSARDGFVNEVEARPAPPERPTPQMCCGGGCVPCIHDYYEEALARYEIALREWRARHPEAPG